jgi:AcrR family transcriptional regulator
MRHKTLLVSPIAIRVPQQARSRRRVKAIVRASNALIRKHGVMGLKMSEVATVARVPIGSVYQYFPTKSALISHLFALNLDVYHRLGQRYLMNVRSALQCATALRRLLREVYADNRKNVLMREIWAGAQADRTIRELHLWDNVVFCTLFAEALKRVGSVTPEQLLWRRVRIVNEMWDGTVRLAITLGELEGRALIEESLELGIRNLDLLAEP